MLNTILMVLNSIIGLMLIAMATSVNKKLSGCSPSQKLVNSLQGLTIIGTIIFILGLSFLLASYKCKSCGDLIMPSLFVNIGFYFILGVTLVALSAIIKQEDKSKACSSSTLTTSMIVIGVLMFVLAIAIIIFLFTPYGRVFLKVRQKVNTATSVVQAVSQAFEADPADEPTAVEFVAEPVATPVIEEPVAKPVEAVSAFSGCRFSKRHRR